MFCNKCIKNLCPNPRCFIGPTGPTGPQGIPGRADTIAVGNTTTIEPGLNAKVTDRTGSPNHIFDFEIPKGETGQNGKGLEITGIVETVEDLPNDAQNGECYLVGLAEPRTLYVYDLTLEMWLDNGHLQGPSGEDGLTPEIGENGNWFIGEVDTGKPSRGEKGEQGDKGENGEVGQKGSDGTNGTDGVDGSTPKIGENGNWFIDETDTGKPSRGATGPEIIREGYFVTLNVPDNAVPTNGLEIQTGARLPIKRREVDDSNLFVLDSNDNTIQFNSTGTYEVVFTTNAYVKKSGESFNAETDFVSIGFRAVDSPIVYVGANNWSFEEVATNIVGAGVFVVTSIAEPFELVNLQKKSVFINGGKIEQVITDSYFSCPIVTLIIKKLS